MSNEKMIDSEPVAVTDAMRRQLVEARKRLWVAVSELNDLIRQVAPGYCPTCDDLDAVHCELGHCRKCAGECKHGHCQGCNTCLQWCCDCGDGQPGFRCDACDAV